MNTTHFRNQTAKQNETHEVTSSPTSQKVLSGFWPRQTRQAYALNDRHCATGPLSLAFLGLYSGRFGGGEATRLDPGWRCRFAGGVTLWTRQPWKVGCGYGRVRCLTDLFISCHNYLSANYEGSCLHDVYHLHSSTSRQVLISLRKIFAPHLFRMLQIDRIGIKHDWQKKNVYIHLQLRLVTLEEHEASTCHIYN